MNDSCTLELQSPAQVTESMNESVVCVWHIECVQVEEEQAITVQETAHRSMAQSQKALDIL